MNARNAYLGQSVATASPARLLVMLLERLALDVHRAEAAQNVGEFLEASSHLIHAQEIVLELMTSLNHDVWEGAGRLAEIYRWLHQELVRANTERDVVATRGCRRIVDPLLETWREAALAAAVAG